MPLVRRSAGIAPTVAVAISGSPGNDTVRTAPPAPRPRTARCRRPGWVLAEAAWHRLPRRRTRCSSVHAVEDRAAERSRAGCHQGDLRTFDLAVGGLTPQLQDRLVVVVHAVEVSLGEQAAVRV